MFRPVMHLVQGLRFWLLALVSLFSVRAAEPHPSLPRPVIPGCLGVNIHSPDFKPGELEMLAAAGFKWVRVDFLWANTERRKGEYDFSAYDRLATALAKADIRAIFVLDYGNPFYAEPGDMPPFTSRADTPEFRGAFAKWAVAAVQHFKNRDYLWEFWNEPNEAFGKSDDPAGDYIALVKAAGEALRAVGLLGLHGEAFLGPATSTIDLPFLEACFKAGLLKYWDAVSVHPTRHSAPETVEEEYRQLRILIGRYAPQDRKIPIVSSGWGYSDAWPGIDQSLQGAYLPREFLTNVANEVVLSIWADWRNEADPNSGDDGTHFSLVGNRYYPGRKPVFDPKPAYLAMKTLQEQLGDFTFNKRLSINGEEGEPVLLFENRKEVRVAVWNREEYLHTIDIPASSGRVNVVSTNGTRWSGTSSDPVNLQFQASGQVSILEFPEPNPLIQLAASVTRMPLEMTFDMPGYSPEFRFGFANVTKQTVVGRIGQRKVFEDRPVLEGNGGEAESVSPDQLFEANLKVYSRQRSPDEADKLFIGVGVAPSAGRTPSQEVAIYQTVRLIPANALIATRLPDERDAIVLRIENPSGQAWEGSMHVYGNAGPGWGKRASLASEEVPLALPKSVPLVVARIPVREPEKTVWWRGFHGLFLKPTATHGFSVPIADSAPVMLDVPNVQVVADGDPKVALKLAHEVEQPPDGPVLEGIPSIRIDYDFAAGWKCLRLVNPTWPPATEKDLLGSPTGLSIWIYGDGKGAATHMRFVDSADQFFQADGPKVNWKGWRQVTFPMRSKSGKPLEHWGGADDGQIHYPIELDSIVVLDNAARQPLSGRIYVSAPTLNF